MNRPTCFIICAALLVVTLTFPQASLEASAPQPSTRRDAIITVHVAGVSHMQPQATQCVLTSSDPQDENTLESPTKVAPVTRQVTLEGSEFRCRLPVSSVTVLRIKTL